MVAPVDLIAATSAVGYTAAVADPNARLSRSERKADEAMALCSMSVLTNALRLRQITPVLEEK